VVLNTLKDVDRLRKETFVMTHTSKKPPTRRTRKPGNNLAVDHSISLLTGDDLYLFNEAVIPAIPKTGRSPLNIAGQQGVYFAVWRLTRSG
jgi:hypothetical protein